jgi:hypothetical protein
VRLSPSPIEFFLPHGFANETMVIGDDCPERLAGTRSSAGRDAPVDLVILAPSARQRRDRNWIAGAADVVRSQLSPDGVAYLLTPNVFHLRRALTRAGVDDGRKIVHVPDVATSRHLVPAGTEAERYAFSGHLAMGRLKRRAASAALRFPRASALLPTAAVLRRGPALPLARWLFELDGAARPGSVLVTPTQSGGIIRRFPAGKLEPDVVAKVSARSDEELRALQAVAPGAGREGARVPKVVSSGVLGQTPFVVQSALSGRSAALLLESGRLPARDVQARVADWLGRWGRSSRGIRGLRSDDLERFILAPAAGLGSGLGGYVDYLRALCEQAVGIETPLVASHGDLTAANILVDASGDLAIVDWENGSPESLPLMDFFYSAADVVAAERGYEDRVRAFSACYVEAGERAAFVESLRRRIADAVQVPDVVQDLAFHACWLHHANNEARRSAEPQAGPFVTILRIVAADPERYRRAARTR